MALYEHKIENALQYLTRSDLFLPTGDKPICYITYDVADALDIYRMIESNLKPTARFYGFSDIRIISLGDELLKYLANHEYREDWLDESYTEVEIHESVGDAIRYDNLFINLLLPIYEETDGQKNTLIVLKDLELIHPYDKIGRVEQSIYNKIHTPTLILYPGQSQGSARQFLNIFPMDGNYRSKNF